MAVQKISDVRHNQDHELRKRFERDPANPRHFLTVWGVGYRFMTEGEPS